MLSSTCTKTLLIVGLNFLYLFPIFSQESFERFSFVGDEYDLNDFNGDGYQDIFVNESFAFGNNTLMILLNQCVPEEVAFDTIHVADREDVTGELLSTDFDMDGDIDLLYQRGDSATLYLLLNNGDLSFEEVELGIENSFRNQIVDFDQDGDYDFLGLNYNKREFYVFINDGANNFEKFTPLEDDKYISTKAPFDVDDDGDLDIVIGMQSWDNREMIFLINESNNQFSEQEIDLTFTNQDVDNIVIMDYDKDGIDDIVYHAADTKLIAMLKDQDANYTELKILPAEGADYYPFVSYVFGDLNNDNIEDIVTGGMNLFEPYPIHYFKNQNDIGLEPLYEIIEVGGVYPAWDVQLLDLNCDGLLDVMADNGGDNWYFINNLDLATSVEDAEKHDFSIFPNPSSDWINMVNLPSNILAIGVYDVLGKKLFNISNGSQSFDVSQLTSGQYILKISAEKELVTTLFIKQ